MTGYERIKVMTTVSPHFCYQVYRS
jgi:hypothetical protein